MALLVIRSRAPLTRVRTRCVHRVPKFDRVLLTKGLTRTQVVVRHFGPKLVLLSGCLPSNEKVGLLRRLIRTRCPNSIIFAATTDSVRAISRTMHYNMFSCLVGPVTCRQLKRALAHFHRHGRVLRDVSDTDRGRVSRVFGTCTHNRPGSRLPANVSPLALGTIQGLFGRPNIRRATRAITRTLAVDHAATEHCLRCYTDHRLVVTRVIRNGINEPRHVCRDK